MSAASLVPLLAGAGTFLTGVAAVIKARLRPGDATQRKVRELGAEIRALRREVALSEENLTQARNDLRTCRTECWAARDELSEARTEVEALRKLLPDGEWWRRLGGLDR